MRVLFLDPGARSYHVDTPLHEPLGGTESAIVYLAEALGQQGVDVALANGRESSERIVIQGGISRVSAACVSPDRLQESDVILVNAAAVAPVVRAGAPGARIVLWSGREDDQPQVRELSDVAVREMFAGFAFVSQWQAAQYTRRFGIDPRRVRVLRNGIAPSVEVGAVVQPMRADPHRVAYTSVPYRGLSVLLDAWPLVRRAVPDGALHVFSDMALHGGDDRAFAPLYARCRATEGIRYWGTCAQPILARELAKTAVLAYPGLWPETSCISVLEALASGCRVVTSTRGALPETCAGFASLVEPGSDFTERYAAAVCAALLGGSSEETAAAVLHVLTHHCWAGIARAWRAWLEQLVRS